MEIIKLLPLETIARLVAEGLLSPAVARRAKEQRAEELAELRAIERRINRAYQQKGTALSERELRDLIEDYPGRPPRGTTVKKEGRRWKQRTRMPESEEER